MGAERPMSYEKRCEAVLTMVFSGFCLVVSALLYSALFVLGFALALVAAPIWIPLFLVGVVADRLGFRADIGDAYMGEALLVIRKKESDQ